nr:MAG TPA_asm: hypothetical protein [Caudoviricetes sp.]DAT90169.1 MAG TPA: hypothetical protein [Caudoviricetes sp.]
MLLEHALIYNSPRHPLGLFYFRLTVIIRYVLC